MFVELSRMWVPAAARKLAWARYMNSMSVRFRLVTDMLIFSTPLPGRIVIEEESS